MGISLVLFCIHTMVSQGVALNYSIRSSTIAILICVEALDHEADIRQRPTWKISQLTLQYAYFFPSASPHIDKA